MKRNVVLMMVLLLVSVMAAHAVKPYILFSSPEDVVSKSREVRKVIHRLLVDGYEIQNEEPFRIYYFMQPQGTHMWGSIVVTMTRTYGENSLRVDYAKVTVRIQTVIEERELLGYRAERVQTEEYTVY